LPNNFELEVILKRSGKKSLAGFSLMTAVNRLCCAATTSTAELQGISITSQTYPAGR
jgi:hypothetical protein